MDLLWTQLKPDKAHFVIDEVAATQSPILASEVAALRRMPSVRLLMIRGGERVKSLRRLELLIQWMDDGQIARRSEPLVAVGGGAILDAASLAASLYRRGTSLVKIPTTLTGMIDAGFAAKTAVNFGLRKNLVGTFYPPQLTIVDPGYLSTCGLQYIRAGAAEMIKTAAVSDASLVAALENDLLSSMSARFQTDSGRTLIRRTAAATANLLWDDLYESELDRPLDFGHSISKQLEQVLRPRLTHGSAVALDMAMFSVAAASDRSRQADRDRLLRLLRDVGLPVFDKRITSAMLGDALHDTSIHRDGTHRSPIPRPLGEVVFEDFQLSQLLEAQEWLRDDSASFRGRARSRGN